MNNISFDSCSIVKCNQKKKNADFNIFIATLCSIIFYLLHFPKIIFKSVFSAKKKHSGKMNTDAALISCEAADCNQTRRHWLKITALVSIILLLSTSIMFWCLSLGVQVSVNGYALGCFKNEQELQDIIHNVELKAQSYLGHPYAFHSEISYSVAPANLPSGMTSKDIEELLFSQIAEIRKSYALRIDGKLVGACDDKDGLYNALGNILEEYCLKNNVSDCSNVKFVQGIDISEELLSSDYVYSLEEIKEILSSPKTKAQNYIIQSGDTFYALALKFGTSIDTLEEINPDIVPNKLKVGQSVATSKDIYYLTVEETRTEVYTESIPFSTITEKNDKMYKNQSKIKTAGKNGTKKVTASVVYQNGEEVSRNILSEDVITEPVSQVKEIGTLTPPANSPTGKYIRPFSGYISSNYGYRGTEFHTGVDFAGAAGSAICASDGGTVSYAGWKGNYGYCVIIDHGSGIQTLYAHCSSLLVKVGSKVAKGSTIAKVGSTGRSTGPHVHFEVRVNGKCVNPWNYIK